jgi:hypothetical protein
MMQGSSTGVFQQRTPPVSGDRARGGWGWRSRRTRSVVLAQLVVLRLMAGHRRTRGIMLAAGFVAAAWMATLVTGGRGAETLGPALFVAGMVLFALGTACSLRPCRDRERPGSGGAARSLNGAHRTLRACREHQAFLARGG